ncbi:methionyl-tRNA formyltransferase Fmt [Lysinibacillus capsici]|uniref:Methionyl-tRNA formyltransferase Fmt n=1 Tax=Lysinibacillus capsici TaxID=2115968 RepID=A0A2X0XPL6_9BACI|nr:formyltransferase family protein [Lysinibacillus capsici]SPT99493.1 methionyl-tRNA formyltransferase Fmt [Lysinibacillus capsici]
MTKIDLLISKSYGLECLKYIINYDKKVLNRVYTLDDRNDKRTKFQEIIDLCKENQIEFSTVSTNKEFEMKFKQRSDTPDYVIVVGWYWIISEGTLNFVKREIIGFHYSLLPKYRGGSPLVWAIINNEQETGVTMFCFREKIDNGPIIEQTKISIEETDDINTLVEKSNNIMLTQLENNLPKIIDGKMEMDLQNEMEATYCSNRIEEFGKINWNKPARSIYNFVRAQTFPYPGAFAFLEDGTKIRVLKAKMVSDVWYSVPGQVVRINKEQGSILVGVGNNEVIEILLIYINGSETYPVNVFKSIKSRIL